MNSETMRLVAIILIVVALAWWYFRCAEGYGYYWPHWQYWSTPAWRPWGPMYGRRYWGNWSWNPFRYHRHHHGGLW